MIVPALFLLGALIALLTSPSVMTGYGETAAVENITSKATWFGLFVTSFELALGAESGAAVKTFEITGSKGKGFENGRVVIFTKLNAVTTVGEKVGNLIVGRPYFVVGELTNTFEVALEEGGTGIETGLAIKTESKVALLKEAAYAGAKNARQKVTWTKKTATATQVSSEYTGAEVIVGVEKSQTVTYGGWWESETGQGSAKRLISVSLLETSEEFKAVGEYKLTTDAISYIIGTLVA